MSIPSAAWSRMTSLKARLALLLCLAILPIGLIAVIQTRAVVLDAQEFEQQDILKRTVQAASAERALLRRAHGAATALGATVATVGAQTQTCSDVMAQFVGRTQAYVFAAYTSADGLQTCSSDGAPMDRSGSAEWQAFVEQPRPIVTVDVGDDITSASVIIATVPTFDADTQEFLGAVSVGLPHSLTDTLLAAQVEEVDLALLDETGRVLSASTGITDAGLFETLNLSPEALGVSLRGVTFNVQREGEPDQLAALVPLIEDRVYVLGLWNGSIQNYSVSVLGTLTPLFPILMWLVAFIVGFLALDRLVLRHLRDIRRRMAMFSLDDPMAGLVELNDPPAEIRQIAATYNRMIDRLVKDRTQLAESLEEKEVLLREVHHRVKNNLQLIASILNMQMRSVPEGDARNVLRRVQDRVMSLSTIHKALYTGTSVASVRGDKLLDEVVQAAFNMGMPQGAGVRTSMELERLDLDPDQAVPLALLANETVTNALKYLGQPDDGRNPSVLVHLTASEDRHVVLTIENTVGAPLQDLTSVDGTGLGARLVEAFVAQLGGTYESEEADGLYRFKTRFTAFALDLALEAGEDAETAHLSAAE